MAIPDYQTLMGPALRTLEDGQPKQRAEVRNQVAKALGISDDDRRLTVASGAPVFDSRVYWALTYMAQAGLLRRPQRGMVQITDRGRAVLEEHRDRIDNNLLGRFEEFKAFESRVRKPASTGRVGGAVVGEKTPRETVEVAVSEMNTAVAEELLTRVRDEDPVFLERLVPRVLTAMGYGGSAGGSDHLGKSGDEGLDGVIRQDALGLDRVYVQAKRYAAERSVGRPEIQGFVGALQGAQADRGIFITTSRFTPEARDYAERVNARLILIDGEFLTDLVRHNVGVQDGATYVIKRIDEDFFGDV